MLLAPASLAIGRDTEGVAPVVVLLPGVLFAAVDRRAALIVEPHVALGVLEGAARAAEPVVAVRIQARVQRALALRGLQHAHDVPPRRNHVVIHEQLGTPAHVDAAGHGLRRAAAVAREHVVQAAVVRARGAPPHVVGVDDDIGGLQPGVVIELLVEKRPRLRVLPLETPLVDRRRRRVRHATLSRALRRVTCNRLERLPHQVGRIARVGRCDVLRDGRRTRGRRRARRGRREGRFGGGQQQQSQ